MNAEIEAMEKADALQRVTRMNHAELNLNILIPGGGRSEHSGARATTTQRRRQLLATRVAIGRPPLARFRFRLAGRSRRGPRPRAQCAPSSSRHSPRGGSVGLRQRIE